MLAAPQKEGGPPSEAEAQEFLSAGLQPAAQGAEGSVCGSDSDGRAPGKSHGRQRGGDTVPGWWRVRSDVTRTLSAPPCYTEMTALLSAPLSEVPPKRRAPAASEFPMTTDSFTG